MFVVKQLSEAEGSSSMLFVGSVNEVAMKLIGTVRFTVNKLCVLMYKVSFS